MKLFALFIVAASFLAGLVLPGCKPKEEPKTVFEQPKTVIQVNIDGKPAVLARVRIVEETVGNTILAHAEQMAGAEAETARSEYRNALEEVQKFQRDAERLRAAAVTHKHAATENYESGGSYARTTELENKASEAIRLAEMNEAEAANSLAKANGAEFLNERRARVYRSWAAAVQRQITGREVLTNAAGQCQVTMAPPGSLLLVSHELGRLGSALVRAKATSITVDLITSEILGGELVPDPTLDFWIPGNQAAK